MKKPAKREGRARARNSTRSQIEEARRSLQAALEKNRLEEERRWWQEALHESGIGLGEDAAPGLTWQGLIETFLAAVPPREARRTFMVVAMLTFRRYLSCPSLRLGNRIVDVCDDVSTVGPYVPGDASRMMSALRATVRRRGSRAGRRTR